MKHKDTYKIIVMDFIGVFLLRSVNYLDVF